jgi:hypothetical protein
MQWLWHRGVDRLIADDADVGRDSQLDKVVVGRGARIQGPSIVKETVIFGGTSLSGLSTLERTVATPQRLYKLEDRKTP